ncbi:MAG: DUF4292 domain-containing protein [Chitinophagaceae bacterium]|nr:DUF4292 domain-containing protein [Chitinophagaceae bacterium]
MKSMMRIITTILIISIAISCRTTKKIQTVITSKKDTVKIESGIDPSIAHADSMKYINQVYQEIDKNRIDFQTFSAKIKVDFEDKNGKKNDFNAFIRLKKDSILWISINALLGIEAFRAIITPDSVKILNKLDKVIQLRSVEYLQEVARVPFTFKELQNIIIGNPVYLDSAIHAYKKEEDRISLISIGSVFKHLLTVSSENYALQNSKLDDVDVSRARTCQVIYGDYERKGNLNFSAFRKITVSERSKLDIELRYKQYEFNEELNFPFSIPKNYKRE